MLAITPQQDDTCLAPWTQDPEAKAILASFTASPIQKTRLFDTRVQTRDEWTAYTGDRADKLKAIRDRHFLAMERASIALDKPVLMEVFLAEPSVEQAITAACAKANPLRLVGEA